MDIRDLLPHQVKAIIVWVKYGEWSWWPAIVTEREVVEKKLEEDDLPPQKVRTCVVRFFKAKRDGQYARVEGRQVVEFLRNFDSKLRSSYNEDKLVVTRAAREALCWIVKGGLKVQKELIFDGYKVQLFEKLKSYEKQLIQHGFTADEEQPICDTIDLVSCDSAQSISDETAASNNDQLRNKKKKNHCRRRNDR